MVSKNKNDDILVDNPKKLKCPICGKVKLLRFFYKSKDPRFAMYGDGRCYYCKDCLKDMCYLPNGIPDKDGFKKVLREYLNLPFFDDLYKKALNNEKDTLGSYISQLNIVMKGGNLTWEDGETDENNKKQLKNNQNEFIVTQEIIDKWGEGYTQEEYRLFEKKWAKLIDNYGEKTSFHTENLITYIRFRVKEEIESAKGNVREAKEWAALADKAAQNAKINVSQLSKSDLSGGVDLICQIFEAAETEVGIIPLLPRLLEQPYDDADMIIWAIINYARRLEDKPRVLH